jgi:hypothetical protein
LSRELFLLSAKEEIAVPESAKTLLVKLKSFQFAVFCKILTPEASFLLSAKLGKANFPKARKVPCQDRSHFAFWQIFIAAKLLPSNR